MKCSLLHLVAPVLLCQLALCMLGRVFEFLNDDPNSRLIMATHGDKSAEVISMTTKIVVPMCIDVTYVRVVLSNVDILPYVTFNQKSNVVNITDAGPLNSSTSFQIFAKGVVDRFCTPQKLKSPGYQLTNNMVYRYLPEHAYKIGPNYVRYP